ncbi:MAG: RNA-binding S4 domain-containing protein [Breznakia sp.]
MRLDKYLKVARIVKRRSTSKELADQQRVFVNGRCAKASSDVKINDRITVHFGNRELQIKVLATPKQVSKQEAILMYEIVEEKRFERNVSVE